MKLPKNWNMSVAKTRWKLDEFLDYPRFDPHGDPIPDSNGKWASLPRVKLTEFDFNKTAQVTSVGGQSAELLENVKHRNIKIERNSKSNEDLISTNRLK